MTLNEIKQAVMFQTDNDRDDLGDFMPYLLGYINEGYDRLLYVWKKKHVQPGTDYPPLTFDADQPVLPLWSHNAIVDWATYMIYRNGNGMKQQRGMAYRSSFQEIRARLVGDGQAGNKFINIPV